MFQAGLNTHRQERAGQPGDWTASPPRLSSRGTGTRADLGARPLHQKGGSAIRDARESACWALCRPPALTPHTLLSANLPPVRLSTQVLPSFPDMTSKQPRGSLEVLAAGYLAPIVRALAPCLPRDAFSQSGPPPLLAAGPPAIIPGPLQRTSCLWVHPHEHGRHILSLLSPSDGTTETADSSSRVPCSTHWGSLKAPWERPLLSLSAWSPALCKQALCPGVLGSALGAGGIHVTKPPPLLSHPATPPTCLSLAPGPALPGVIPQALAPLFKDK
ncbi:unnamed protein product [Rangifer tarandus platyrhynchus]|uniref:Uncharacterized protein n=1 Tax=Rangifer tarandus platyrhynchus TaxID=3082113 RepID=A0AC59YDI0_RANTA